MTTLADWLTEQKKVCERATEGPWSAFLAGDGTVQVDIGERPSGHNPCVVHWSGFDANSLGKDRNQATAIFIASARTALPQALAIIEVYDKVLQYYINATEYPTAAKRAREQAERILNGGESPKVEVPHV